MARCTRKPLIVGDEFWRFYKSLDREFKELFAFEVMNHTGWKKSRFYTRMKGGEHWKQKELNAVQKCYDRYKKYAYGN